MLDLKNIPDSEFCVVVTPPVTRVAMQVTLDETGNVALSGKLAEHFAKKPVEIRFNKDFTVIQFSCLLNDVDNETIVFPKNGRKMIPNAVELLKKHPYPCLSYSEAMISLKMGNGGGHGRKALYQSNRRLPAAQSGNNGTKTEILSGHSRISL